MFDVIPRLMAAHILAAVTGRTPPQPQVRSTAA
mgnify:CR=1 FL=1